MLKRREILPAIGLVPALLWGRRARAADPAGFVRQVGDQLVGVINGPGSMTDKRGQIRQIIDRFVDVDGIGRFCLGRFWRLASPRQQASYVRLFHAVLLDNILDHIGTGRRLRDPNFSVAIGRTRADGAETEVLTTVERPGSPALIVVWLVRQMPDGPRIVDLRALGVSVRLTVRDDIAAYLARHDDSIPRLLVAMRRMVRAAQAPAAP